MDANLSYLVERIEAELGRLDATDDCPKTRGSGIDVYADIDLPRGWVRLGDGTGEAWGLAADFLKALEGTKVDDATDDEGNPSGWHSAWAATNADEFLVGAPADDVDDHWAIEDTGIETDEESEIDRLKVVAVLTNGGLRYHFAPCNPDYFVGNYALGFSPRFESAAEALSKAEAFASEESARERTNW